MELAHEDLSLELGQPSVQVDIDARWPRLEQVNPDGVDGVCQILADDETDGCRVTVVTPRPDHVDLVVRLVLILATDPSIELWVVSDVSGVAKSVGEHASVGGLPVDERPHVRNASVRIHSQHLADQFAQVLHQPCL